MWKIQQVTHRRPHHVAAIVAPTQPYRFEDGAFWGKYYTGSSDDRQFEYFARQALASTQIRSSALIRLVDCRLDCQLPYLVYGYLDSRTLTDWLSAQNQKVPLAIQIGLVRQAAEGLVALHSAGWVHGNLSANHLIVSQQDRSLRLIGLGGLETVGEVSRLSRMVDDHDAPERQKSEYEVSTAADIYSLGIILRQLMGGSTSNSPLLRGMLSPDPEGRPSSVELVKLLRQLEFELLGQSFRPTAQSA